MLDCVGVHESQTQTRREGFVIITSHSDTDIDLSSLSYAICNLKSHIHICHNPGVPDMDVSFAQSNYIQPMGLQKNWQQINHRHIR
jgi:hypothetical protein